MNTENSLSGYKSAFCPKKTDCKDSKNHCFTKYKICSCAYITGKISEQLKRTDIILVRYSCVKIFFSNIYKYSENILLHTEKIIKEIFP